MLVLSIFQQGWYVAVFPFEPQFEDGVNHLEAIARLLDEVSFYKSLFVFGDGAWCAKPVFCYYRLGIEMSLSHADGTQNAIWEAGMLSISVMNISALVSKSLVSCDW